MEDSSFGRIVGALVSPTKTFASIGERPTWLVPLLVLVVLSVASGYLVTQKMDMEDVVRDAIAQQGRQVSEDQIQQGIEFQERFGPALAVAGPLVGLPVGYLLTALLFWVAFKLVGGDFSYKTGFAVTTHGFLPGAVAALLSLPVVLGRSEIAFEDVQTGSLLASNLGVLAPEEGSVLLRTLLSSLDVFSIWSVVLLTIGFAAVSKLSRTTAAVVVVGLWVFWILLKLGWVAITT